MNMAAALIANETAGCTLYELEDNLQALVNSIDLAQEPAIREFILEKIGQEVRRVKEKRDAVVAFLRHCESQQEFADAEIKRIQKRQSIHRACPRGIGIVLDPGGRTVCRTRSAGHTAA